MKTFFLTIKIVCTYPLSTLTIDKTIQIITSILKHHLNGKSADSFTTSNFGRMQHFQYISALSEGLLYNMKLKIIALKQFQSQVMLEVTFAVLELLWRTHLIQCVCMVKREKWRSKGEERAKISVSSSLETDSFPF